jgi:ABC-type branched-subunit amino acid transport system substrate-binding protein
LTRKSLPVGILFSTTGSYSLLGRDALDGALMALAEIGEDDSLPFVLQPVIADPGGVAERYETACEELIRQGVRHVIGGITSWSRKEMIPVLEKHDALLWYPCPYEGFEANDHVIYLGACPNQHILPLFAHVLPRFGRRGYLVGSNYIWGWETNRIAREILTDCDGAVLGERYLPLGSTDVERLVGEIEQARPDFVLNTLIGPSSHAFLKAYAALGRRDQDFRADRRPVLSCNLAESELDIVGEDGVGHLCTSPYFEDLAIAGNEAFRARARARFGSSRRASAFLVGAYAAGTILGEAIREAGTDEPKSLLPILSSRRFATPMGDIAISGRTQHAALAPNLARIVPGNGFEVIAQAPGPVEADPYLSQYDPAALLAAPASGPAPLSRLRIIR